jgi:4-hydroxy-tetrahydrodipicolinate synthase
MLTYSKLKGIYAGLPLPWKEDGSVDEKVFSEKISRLADYGVHGMYNGGSTGEFFAADFDLFKQITDILIDTLKGKNVYTQVGIGALTTEEMVKRGHYAIEKGVDGLQVAFPWYYKIGDDEAVELYKDLGREFNNFPLIHYDSARCKRKLDKDLLSRIYEVCPSLIGIKYTSYDINVLKKYTIEFPNINFFVGTPWLATFMQQANARGSYDVLVYMNPPLVLKMYDLCCEGKFEEAILIQEKFQKFYMIVSELGFLNFSDSAIDRCIGLSTGFLKGYSTRIKKPYSSVSAEMLEELKRRVANELPELLNY